MRTAVAPSQATDVLCLPYPRRKRQLKRQPLGPGITLTPTRIGWREEELAEHICLRMSKHWPYIFGTSNGISAQVDQVEDKCLGFIACKHRGRGTRHHAGNTERKQCLGIKLRRCYKEMRDTAGALIYFYLNTQEFNRSRLDPVPHYQPASLKGKRNPVRTELTETVASQPVPAFARGGWAPCSN